MIKNFFLITFRNVLRHKVFTFINVTGLAIGLAASLLIVLWVQDELSYDRFNVNGENIFRVEEDQFYSGRRYHVTVTPHPSGPVWKAKIPEIKEQTRINRLPRLLVRFEDKVFFETAVVAADSGLFRMFTLPFQSGDPITALSFPHAIVLSEKIAEKYFGKSNPIGKTLTLENRFQFTVTGVMKNIPKNSIFTFEVVLPYSFLREIGAISNSWGNNSIFTYVEVEKGADIKAVNKKLTDIVTENNSRNTTKFVLFPLLDIRLHAQFGFTENKGAVIAVYIFSLIAFFVLLIACINFINLSTAKSSTRGKEIGIKKVAGADQKTMIFQFMMESLLLVSVAMVFALLFVGLALDLFNNVSGKRFVLNDLFQIRFILSFVAVGIIAGLLSGIYPSIYMSSIKPVTVLKGDSGSGRGNSRLRQILVVIQFTLSILITISATFMYLQLKFLQTKELGYDKKDLICIPMSGRMKTKYYSLKKDLENNILVQGVTASTQNPVNIGSNSGGSSWDGKDPEKTVLIGTNGIDYDYLKTMKMELKSGRDFSRDFPGDIARDTTGNFLVNEEVAKIMGSGDQVDKNFRFMGLRGKIVGVLKNFHFKGADQPIEPMAFALADTNYLNVILIRLVPGKIPEALKSLEKTWKDIVPEYPFQYTFVEQDYENLFRAQMRLTGLLKYFTFLALIIACLGLYGLSSYSAERRTNEIGIRKVMGAGSFAVMYTLAKEFMFPVIISLVIAIPVGWIIVEKLLNQFANRIEINILVFVLIAAGAILIALLTVIYHAYKSTGINPAEALKVE
jgi:putative ABC transport system permease protein